MPLMTLAVAAALAFSAQVPATIPTTMPAPAPGQAAQAPTPHQTPPPRGQGNVPVRVSAEDQRATSGNVRIDLAITDNHTGTPVRKTVTMLLEAGRNGLIRTAHRNGWELNVDAHPTLATNGRLRVSVTFEYTAAADPSGPGSPTSVPAKLHESLTVVLEDGKPLLVSQSADPANDRRVTVELTASVQR